MEECKPDVRSWPSMYRGPRLDIRVGEVRGGVRRELVVHPGACAILAVGDPQTLRPSPESDFDDEPAEGADPREPVLVLIRNERFAVGHRLWEIPAGTLEPRESPADAAFRELREETGYEASSIEPLPGFYTAPGFCTERMHLFLASGLSFAGQALEATEAIEAECVRLSQALAMIGSGQIEDAKTIAAILYYDRFVVGR